MIRLKIEEDNRNAKKKSRKSSTIIGVNIVEEAPTKDKKRKKSNGQVRTGQEEIQRQLL